MRNQQYLERVARLAGCAVSIAAATLVVAVGAADTGGAVSGATTRPAATPPVALLDVAKLQPMELIGDPRFRHPGTICCLRVIDQGRAILSCGWGNGVRIWDAATGKELSRYELPPNAVPSVTALADGNRLVVCYRGGQLGDVIDRQSGKVLREVTERQGPSTRVGPVITPDQKRLFAADGDGNISQWDLETGEMVGSWAAHKNSVTWGLALAPDGKTLVSAGWGQDTSIAIWEAPTGTLRHRIDDRPPRLGVPMAETKLAFAPHEQKFASTGNKTLRLWDAAEGKELWNAPIPDGNPEVAFNPDGLTLAVMCKGGRLHVFNTADGSERLVIDTHGPMHGEARPFTFSADGKDVFIGTANTICRFEAPTGKRLFPPTELGDNFAIEDVLRMAPAPSGGRLYTVESAPHVLAWDIPQKRVVRFCTFGPDQDNANSLSVSSDGKNLLVGTSWHGAGVFDVETGRSIVAFPPPLEPGMPEGWFRTRGGQGVACVGRGGGLTIYDMKGGESRLIAGTAEENAYVDRRLLAASSDGQRAAVKTSATHVKVWNVLDGTLLAELDLKGAGYQSVYYAAFVPDGMKLLLGDGSGRLCLWDYAPSHDARATPEQLARWVSALESDDYKAREDATARLIDSGPGAESALTRADGRDSETMQRAGKIRLAWKQQTPRDHVVGAVLQLKEGLTVPVAHPDGKHWAAIAGFWMANEIVLGELTPNGPRELRRLRDEHVPHSLIFAPDGKTLYAGNANATISMWRVDQ